MKANDFLKEVIKSIGLHVGPEGEVIAMLPSGEGEYSSEPIVSKTGYPFLLPTNSNLQRLVKVESDGKVVLEFLPFNPILEDDIGRETESFKSYARRLQIMLTLETYETGFMLINVAKNDKLISTKGVRVEKFLTSLGKHITTKNMKIVDETTGKTFIELIKASKEPDNKKIVHLTVKRRGEINGKIYPVVAYAYFPLMEELMKLDPSEDGCLNGVKLRKKDVIVFQEMFKTLFPMVDSSYIYTVHSERDDYPMFDSTYRLYLDILSKHGEIVNKLSEIKDEEFDPVVAKVSFNSKDIGDILNKISKEISRIPTERSLLSPQAREESEEIRPVTIPQQQQTQVAQQQVQQPRQQPQYIPVDQMGQPLPGYTGVGYGQQVNGVIPYPVNNTGFMGGSALDTINAAMNPYQQPYQAPMNNYYGMPMQSQGYFVAQPQQLNPYGFVEKKPLGLTGDSEF